MRQQIVLWLLVPVAAILGAGIGYFVARANSEGQYATDFANHVDIMHVDESLRAVRDVKYLTKLRNGDVPGVVDALERDLDGNLIGLSTYHDDVPAPFRRRAVYESLAIVRPYRAEHPSVLGPPKVDAVLHALALTQDSQTTHK